MYSFNEVNAFIEAYHEYADELGDRPVGGWTSGIVEDLEVECEDFITSCFEEREDAFEGWTPEQAGQDFYLTRNGHGAGYWDRGKGEMGDYLTSMAKPYGETCYQWMVDE